MSDHHKFGTHLPRSGRESLLFVLMISLLSVNIIPVIITGLSIGFTLDMWVGVLRVLPLLWVVVIAVVMLTRQPAMWLTGRLVRTGDSFRAHILADTLCSVLLISVILTVVGPWIGNWSVTTESLVHFFENWPRNFMIAFVVEALLAQPVARLVMRGHHHRVDQRGAAVVQAA
ncbi:hypothetical protein ASG73_13865 [Janibacter sp. Soil728]|uniref:hypothetical protein n=1 Tax=Janibacter sp. Soil728 TaxID=1736393 RepID=UPI0007006FBF|nr:hypothetical protein [Janibacter sp. Soil728]KRE35780.1 hypothetical protein ASG73_13865 [Janibacter sp. Soil728]